MKLHPYILLIIIFTQHLFIFAQNDNSVLIVEFGNQILVNNKTDNPKIKILTKDYETFEVESKWANFQPFLSNGIKNKNEIKFETFLNPGKYFIELIMPGGKFGKWQGKIILNDNAIPMELFSFTADPESDEPPKYWSTLIELEIIQKQNIFSISAENQETALNSISFYPKREDKIFLKDGKIQWSDQFNFPNLELAIDLINNGNVNEAEKIVNAVPDKDYCFEKALLKMAIAGRLETENPKQLIENAKHLLTTESTENPSDEVLWNLRIAELFSYGLESYERRGWDWNKQITESGIFDHINFSGMAFEEITNIENHPLNIRASYELAKVCYWNWVEQHGEKLIVNADEHFKKVRKFYPNNKILKMYMGENIQTNEIPNNINDVPEWAFLQKAALDGVVDIIHYWVENRQANNGEFGGKFDDDVEMMRWWPVARTVAKDSLTLVGMEKLVNGIWESGWIENGFSKKLRDVEHSSEPVADTQPMMIALDYGNPIYVERCMQSLDKIDLWTGINKKGHRHFKSSWYSATEIDTEKPKDCDVEMNTRTVKAIRWLAWYNKHPKAMQFLREWSNSWLEDCMRTDKGKPEGIVPASIHYEEDGIGTYTDNWYESGMFWHYYDYTGGTKMLKEFLSSYLLFNDRKYLEPIELTLKLIERNINKNLDQVEKGSEEWITKMLLESDNFAETIEIWRLLTNNNSYDKLIQQIGSDYIKYRLSGEVAHLENGSMNIINYTYFNRDLLTTEAYFTDRVEIKNLRGGQDIGTSHIEAMYNGSSFADIFYPFSPISWKNVNKNLSAVVNESSDSALSIIVFNHSEETIFPTIVFNHLKNGLYNFDLIEKKSGKTINTKNFEIQKRNSDYTFELKSNSEYFVEIKLIKAIQSQEINLADLAITDSELKISNINNDKVKIEIPIHNIGIVDATDFNIKLYFTNNSADDLIESKNIKLIDAPLDLEIKKEKIDFLIDKKIGEYKIVVDDENKINEITEINNSINFYLN
ncbi:MAG: hypothetical protein H6609_14990 [Ignavibacteriales bacterium]|nr:hypothetical protein [Ignavibacteriales bacterium]